MVLGCLPRRDIKQMCLVCDRLNKLSIGKLFSKLYISPREKDMGFFDAITRHPDLSRSIRSLCFESVRFPEKPTIMRYFDNLSSQLRNYDYDYLRATNPAIQSLLARIDGTQHKGPLDGQSQQPRGLDIAGLNRCLQNNSFIHAYKEYSQLASEHVNQ